MFLTTPYLTEVKSVLVIDKTVAAHINSAACDTAVNPKPKDMSPEAFKAYYGNVKAACDTLRDSWGIAGVVYFPQFTGKVQPVADNANFKGETIIEQSLGYVVADDKVQLDKISQRLTGKDLKPLCVGDYISDISGITEKQVRMHHRITKKQIEKGIEQGVVRIEDRPGDGTVCCIGDYWFWFDADAEEMAPDECLNDANRENTIAKIAEALEGFRVDGNEDEYLYYVCILNENGITPEGMYVFCRDRQE